MVDELALTPYDAGRSPVLLDPTPTTIGARPAGGFEQGSPMWWVDRLLRRLERRAADLRVWSDYYDGIHPLNFFDEAVREAFGARFHRFANNFVALCVDGIAERLQVNGFRFKDDQGDDDLWAIWQDNDLDGGSLMAHTEALVKGGAYTLIEPVAGERPRITIEDALDTITELDPRIRRKRLAGLKRWIGDDGRLYVVLYLPDFIFKYRTTAKYEPVLGIESRPALERWQPKGEDWPLNNPLRVVPIVPILNRPKARTYEGRSEVRIVRSNQDLINYYRVMAVIGARFTAYPQRWVKNLPIEIDPVTGLPKKPFRGGMADIWQVSPFNADDPRALNSASQAEFGQFQAASMEPYIRLIEHEVSSMASISGVPYYYLLGEPTAVPPSGESLKAGEARLTRKSSVIEVYFGEGWEETMRVALIAMKDERQDLRNAETRWTNTETRNDAVKTDSITKQMASGAIDEITGLEELGYTPSQIKRIAERKKRAKEEKAREAAQGAPGATETPPNGEVATQPVETMPPAPAGPRMGLTIPS